MHHNKRLCYIFFVEFVAIVGALIRTVVEHLEELRAAKVEHELHQYVCVCVCVCDHLKVNQSLPSVLCTTTNLWIEREVLCKSERVWIILVIISKLLTLYKTIRHMK